MILTARVAANVILSLVAAWSPVACNPVQPPSSSTSSSKKPPVDILSYSVFTEEQIQQLDKAETIERLKWVSRQRQETRGGKMTTERKREFELLMSHLRRLSDGSDE